MKKIIKRIILLFISIVVIIFGFYLHEAFKFAKGIRNDFIRTDSFMKKNGIRPDSMGKVNYEDYIRIKDSLENIKK